MFPQHSQSSSSSVYDSNIWKHLSGTSFSSSSNCSQKDSSFQTSQETSHKSTQSPMSKIYESYISKDPLFSKPSGNNRRRSLDTHFRVEEQIQNKQQIETIAVLTFLVKNLQEKFQQFSENIGNRLSTLTEMLTEYNRNNREESQSYLNSLFEKWSSEISAFRTDCLKISNLEQTIAQKTQEIMSLEKKLEQMAEQEDVKKLLGNVKNTIISECHCVLTTVRQSRNCNSEFIKTIEKKVDNSVDSIKDFISNFKRQSIYSDNKIPTCQCGREVKLRKCPAKNMNNSRKLLVASPAHEVPVLKRHEDNIFAQVRKEFNQPINSLYLTPSPTLNISKKHSLSLQGLTPSRPRSSLKRLSRQNRWKSDHNCKGSHPKTPSPHNGRPTRALLDKSTNKLAVWNYRQRLRSESSFDASEKTDSISEDSSPTFCISFDETCHLSDGSMNEEFDNFTF